MMIRNFSLLALLLVLIPILYSKPYLDNRLYNKIYDRSFNIKYHHPDFLRKDPVNFYSLIHFIEYFALSLIRFITLKHILVISIIWEIIELFISHEWARESWANKLCDLIFNLFGFYFSRMLFNR